jgi:uncharacterized coiled-coil protein SlyX
MATLLNRVCTLCETETWLEDGFVQCDCIKIGEYEWAHGVIETPLCWNDDVDALMHYRQKHYEGMIDRQSDTIVKLNEEIAMWRRRYDNQEKQVDFLLARVANLEKMITTKA